MAYGGSSLGIRTHADLGRRSLRSPWYRQRVGGQFCSALLISIPAKTDFVAEIANARTGFARPYLVYGTMQRPLAFAAPSTDLDYFLYNSGTNQPHNEHGTKTVSSVIHSAWRSPEGNVAFLFVNLQADTTQSISLTIDPAYYGHPGDTPYHLVQTTHTSTEHLLTTTGPATLTLTLEPRQITMLELRIVS